MKVCKYIMSLYVDTVNEIVLYSSKHLINLILISFPLNLSLLLSILCLSPPLPLPLQPLPLFILKEDEVKGTVLREEVEKLHVERNMLLETIEDLKQTVEQTVTGPEMDTKVSG